MGILSKIGVGHLELLDKCSDGACQEHDSLVQGARAQRVEYLLLHEFHSKKFIVPDKYVRMLIGPAMGFEALKCISYPAQACVLDPKINFAEVDSSDGFLESIDGIFSPHDMKRLEAYTNNLVDLQSV
nr:RNA cytidine acetyltransferase 1 [Ipomoea batatas]GME20236.1 RNA cytidine acetyltransferase 1 [Ipomoea batatas]